MKFFVLAVIAADLAGAFAGLQPWWWWVSSLVGLVIVGLGLWQMMPLTDKRGDLKPELRSSASASRRLVLLLTVSGAGLGLAIPGCLSDVLALVALVVLLPQLESLAARERADRSP